MWYVEEEHTWMDLDSLSAASNLMSKQVDFVLIHMYEMFGIFVVVLAPATASDIHSLITALHAPLSFESPAVVKFVAVFIERLQLCHPF